MIENHGLKSRHHDYFMINNMRYVQPNTSIYGRLSIDKIYYHILYNIFSLVIKKGKYSIHLQYGYNYPNAKGNEIFSKITRKQNSNNIVKRLYNMTKQDLLLECNDSSTYDNQCNIPHHQKEGQKQHNHLNYKKNFDKIHYHFITLKTFNKQEYKETTST